MEDFGATHFKIYILSLSFNDEKVTPVGKDAFIAFLVDSSPYTMTGQLNSSKEMSGFTLKRSVHVFKMER